MAAEVSSLVRMINGYMDEHHHNHHQHNQQHQVVMLAEDDDAGGAANSRVLITRDLLGGSLPTLDSTELDLDLQVPSGWEKRLDLKSGKVYLQRFNSPNSNKNTSMSSSSSPSEHKQQQHGTRQTSPKMDDLNFPIMESRKSLNLFDNSSLELKLEPSSSSPTSSNNNYQSVCTLDKVKTALERAEKETTKNKKRSMSIMSNSLSPHSSSSISWKDNQEFTYGLDCEEKSSASFAAMCPSCPLYVLISKNNPKCPQCNTVIPSPLMTPLKKPRIDLNISI